MSLPKAVKSAIAAGIVCAKINPKMAKIVVPTLDQLNQQLEEWFKILATDPLWYKQIIPFLSSYIGKVPKNDQTEALKDRLYDFFADKLESGQIFLASKGPDYDQFRLPIDRVVIHHTSNKPGISQAKLSAIGLLRQYAHDYYAFEDNFGLPTINQPIWSGHFQNGKQVFYAYHWLVRLDGTMERLLEDKYIGWQAGNTDINLRSIGIVLDGDFLDSEPPQAALEGIVKILEDYYPQIKGKNILGHLEANHQTECPGKLFLSSWKEKITERIIA